MSAELQKLNRILRLWTLLVWLKLYYFAKMARNKGADQAASDPLSFAYNKTGCQ